MIMKSKLIFSVLFLGLFMFSYGQSFECLLPRDLFGDGVNYLPHLSGAKNDYHTIIVHQGAHAYIRKNPAKRYAEYNTWVYLYEPETESFRRWAYFCKEKDEVLHLYHNAYVSDSNRILVDCGSTIHMVIIAPDASLRVEESWPDFSEDCQFILQTDSLGRHGELFFDGESQLPERIRKAVRYEPAPTKLSRMDREPPLGSCWIRDSKLFSTSLRATVSSSFGNARYNNPYNAWPFVGLALENKANFINGCSGWKANAGMGVNLRWTMFRHPVVLDNKEIAFASNVENNVYRNAMLAVCLVAPAEISHTLFDDDDGYSLLFGVTPGLLLWERFVRTEILENGRLKSSNAAIGICNRWRLDIHVGFSTPIGEFGIYGNPIPTYRSGIGDKPLREIGFYIRW